MATRDGKGDGGIIIPQEFKDRYDARVERELRAIAYLGKLAKENPGLFPYDDIDCRDMLGDYNPEEGENDGDDKQE